MMAPPKIGPITTAMGKMAKGKPPALICEWSKKLQHPGQFIFMWAAATKRQSGCHSWYSWLTNLGDEKPRNPVPTATPGTSVERMLSPLAHEGRIRIMQAMYWRPLTASELTEATGFKGGALYHHLKELKYASYVKDKDGRYNLTGLGYQLLVTVTCLASQVVVDEDEQGLAVAGWGEGD